MTSTLNRVVPRQVRRQMRLLQHRGKSYRCPFCGFESRDLAMIGHDFPVLRERDVVGGGRRAAQCHRCQSADRERLVYLYLRDHTPYLDHPEQVRVLHIAPEKRLTRALLAVNFATYDCGDLFAEGYHPPAHVREMDVTALPGADASYDLVICNHVLEHVPDDALAMRELRRVLAPGGRAILQVPISRNSAETLEDLSITDPAERERVFGQFDHVRLYGQDYPAKLAAVGFDVERVDLTQEYRHEGVNPGEELFIATVAGPA